MIFRISSPLIPAVNRSSTPYPGAIQILYRSLRVKLEFHYPLFLDHSPLCAHLGVKIPIDSPFKSSIVMTTICVVVESE